MYPERNTDPSNDLLRQPLLASMLVALLCLIFFFGVNLAQSVAERIYPDGFAGFIDSAFATRDITKATVSGIETKWYTGTARTQNPKVIYKTTTLRKGTDYVLRYRDNVVAGTARVYILGINGYVGKIRKCFTIKRRSVAGLTYSAVSKQAYTGEAVKPSFTIKHLTTKLAKNTDYTVAYADNRSVGTATITVTGIGNYTGVHTITFKIRYSLALYGAAGLARTSFAYTGTARKPFVTVKYQGAKLTKNVDYTLTFYNCTSIGTATVKVSGMGAYGFSIKRTYKITADGGRVIDVSEWDGTISWSTVAKKVDVAILRSYVMYSDQSQQRADNNYDSYADGCEEYGIPYGAYGFMNYTSATKAKAQADQLWDKSFSNGHKPLFLCLDLETKLMQARGSKIAAYTQIAMDELRAKAKAAGYGHIKIGLYISNHLYADYGFTTTAGKATIAAADFIWLPSYGTNDGCIPTVSKYFPGYAYDMWQYTSTGSVSGISGNVDVSLIRRSGPHPHYMGWYMKR